MANLIIKSSADNLVLQGSDASPALTVAADGQTTFAEAATMSGNVTMSGTANTLGTVTAGTINSTFIPSGWHKIEVFRSSTDQVGTTAGGAYVGGNLTFTPTFNCHAIAMGTFGFRRGSSGHAYFRPQLCDSAGTTVLITYTQIASEHHQQGNQEFISWCCSSSSSLTGGTEYQMRLLAADLGGTLNSSNDPGEQLQYQMLCFA